jgi:hypothetical protein
MYRCRIQSDQLYKWSDKNTETADRRPAQTPPRASAPTAPAPGHPAWLSHRALQAMWQAGMQVRRRSWSWPQVLSFGELPGSAAPDGLRAAGVLPPDHGVAGQLLPSSRDLRADLRDQSRAAAPARGVVRGRHERSTFRPPHIDRCGIGRRAPRQHARRLARRRPQLFRHCGDSQ